jgi:hypothetical protein
MTRAVRDGGGQHGGVVPWRYVDGVAAQLFDFSSG